MLASGPIIVVAIGLLILSMPTPRDATSSKQGLRGFDWIGGTLSVCWPIPLIFALQEGGIHYEWSSGTIIGTLATAAILLSLFSLYEAWASYKTKVDVIFPARFITDPQSALLLFSMFLLGMPFSVMFIQLPQRFQGVNFTSAERAGILLLPVSLLTPVGAMVGGALNARKVPAEYLLLTGTAVISIGTGLLSSLSVESSISPITYGYEVIIGFGLGLASSPYFIILYTCVEEKDAPVGTGILNMLRTLGGAVAIAVCSALHNTVWRDKSLAFLSPAEIAGAKSSGTSIAQLPQQSRLELGRAFGRSYNKQFKVIMAFTVLNFAVAILLSVVRKRKGAFGKLPIRREENEFMKTVEKVELKTDKQGASKATESCHEAVSMP